MNPANGLASTTQDAEGDIVDFSGRGLKLDTESDAKPIVDAIKACKRLECLILEGNTLGVDAAKAVAKALESQPSFKRALWKDAFTGRLKDEIPRALTFLGGGLILAQAHLTELDLSDNALGPIGMEGLVTFIKSPVFYSMKTLRLNNNGLGIYGGMMLAKALLDCLNTSREAGSGLALRTFIVGRNRLENQGAVALSEFFQAAGTLEEVQMPQNFIRHPGITALAEAFKHNTGLRVLNLNDNTFTWRGSKAMAAVLPLLQHLTLINFGDCLVRTKGAQYLAQALSGGHNQLQEVYMDHGEINLSGAKQLTNALKGKPLLRVLDLDGNQLGEDGCIEIKEMLSKLSVLQSLSDDEGEPDTEEEDEEEEEEEDEEEEEEDGEVGDSGTEEQVAKEEDVQQVNQMNLSLAQLKMGGQVLKSTVTEFLNAPTLNRLHSLGADKITAILQHIQEANKNELALELYAEATMKLSSVVNGTSTPDALHLVRSCVDAILTDAFRKAESAGKLTLFNNTLLVYMGLIKSEDKKLKLTWSLSGVMLILHHVVVQAYVPKKTLETFNVFFSQSHPALEKFSAETAQLKKALGSK